ncbi:glycosyltransferase family 2 protein [Bacillus haimaensis]|uniref:glycosyltransferase family 2 protein n=1 Tax=Bacillus haimaensis TaxID=3160967 RepID=UPI003AA80BEC
MALNEYPLVSVVTPSYNQAKFIAETIDSVLSQDYPNIEHIVIDGGSTDGTLEILKKYRKQYSNFHFVSEKDRGQSHAVNKGVRKANGEIIGWLNSDDTYLPGAIRKAVNHLNEQQSQALCYGKANFTDDQNKPIRLYPVEPYSLDRLFQACIICQPAAFFRKKIFMDVGGVDEDLYFCMDYDLWMRIAKKYPIGYIDDFLANSRLHDSAKTVKDMNDIGFLEIFKVSNKNFGTVSNHWVWAFAVNNYGKGRDWLLIKLKQHSIFGSNHGIISKNQLQNASAPSSFQFKIGLNKRSPFRALIIQSPKIIPVSYVYLNGRFHMKTNNDDTSIELNLSNLGELTEIDLKLVIHPLNYLINPNTNNNSYLINHILPLTNEEYEFYSLLGLGPKVIKEWLNNNRFPKPRFH